MLPLDCLYLSGVRSNHLSYRPSPPPTPHRCTTLRRHAVSEPTRPFVQLSVVASYNGLHSQSRRGPFFGRNSSSSSSSNSSSRSSYSARSSRSSSSRSSSSTSSSKPSSTSLSSSKSPNCSSPRLSPRRS